jgi:CheY-like chemotaxis protein
MDNTDKILNILYVEDEDDLREIVPAIILRSFNVQIHTLPSGNKAIEILKLGRKFDLIISDYMMNDGTGADLQQFMKRTGINTPFILYTNTIEPHLPEKSKNFIGIIEKVNWEKLIVSISSALNYG